MTRISLRTAMRHLVLAGAVLVITGAAGQVKAQLNLATDFDPSTNFNTNPGQPVRFDEGTYGYSFAVGSSPLTVTTLATAYAGAQGNVRIYESGTSTDIAEAFITGLQVANSQHGNPFGYTDIAPVVLNANTTYDIVWDTPFFGQAYSPLEPGYSYNPDITFGSGISSMTVGSHPATDEVGQGAYFGPSLVVASDVPEPSTLAFLAGSVLGGAAFLRGRRRARKTV